MRQMLAEYLQHSDLLGWSLLAMVLFLAVFVGSLVRLWRRRPADFDDLARLPLEDDRHE